MYLLFAILTVLAIAGNRVFGLGLMVFSLVLYPEFVRVDTGLVQLSAARMVALIIVIKNFGKKEFGLDKFDFLVVLIWLLQLISNLVLGSTDKVVINVIGRSLDTLLMYFAVRVAIRSSDDIRCLCKYIFIIGIVAALLAIVESLSANSIYTQARAQNMWQWGFRDYEARHGLFRAYGATLNPIYWGLTMLFCFVFGVVHFLNNRNKLNLIGVCTLGLGVASSMSSGPIIGLVVFLLLYLLFSENHRVKYTAVSVLVIGVMVEILTERHLWDFGRFFALNSDTAWYRSKLISVAVERYFEYIYLGVGGKWPHYWGSLIDGRDIVDIVNQYLYVALQGGFAMLFCYVIFLIGPVVIYLRSTTGSLSDDPTGRCLVALIFTVAIMGMTVAFFNPYENFLYVAIGLFRQHALFVRNRVSGDFDASV